jgi:O-antigen ligase
LFLLGVVLAAWGSAIASPAIWALSLACLAATLFSGRSLGWQVSPLALAIWAYTAWTVIHTAFISRAYNPTGLFDPCFLLAGFTIGRTFEREQRQRCYYALAGVVAVLALWGVGQIAFGAGRGRAVFETANTLASVVNMALASALVMIVYGAPRRLGILAAILFAGLLASFSRGGAMAILVTAVALCAFPGRPTFQWRRFAKVAPPLLAGAAIVFVAMALARGLPSPGAPAGMISNLDSVRSRLELYRLAWSTLDFSWGIGYLAFRHVLEVGRATVPSYGESAFTSYVHNDFLQTLLELGIAGLAALIAILALAARAATRRSREADVSPEEGFAALAGVLTVVVHAFVDFPLHVPLCLFLFGFGAGVLDRGRGLLASTAPGIQTQRLVTLVLVAGAAVLLARAVIAEGAAAYAMKKWLLGQTRDAASGFEVAQRADPADWRYHLYAGQFWFAQAAQSGKPEHAQRADSAFAAGQAANPLEPSSALGRAFTNLRYASLLPAPAPPATIAAWADQALMVAPVNPAVRREYAEIRRRLAARP